MILDFTAVHSVSLNSTMEATMEAVTKPMEICAMLFAAERHFD